MNIFQKITITPIVAIFLQVSALSKNVLSAELLQKPLITGASVSADWGTLSPGKTLALRYTEKSNIKTIAFGGQPGQEVIKEIQSNDFKDRSIIIAVDFFFWDSTLPEINNSIKALEKMISQASNLNLPIVLGEIPELLPGRQINRIRLNQEIATKCASYKQCFLMPFDQLHRQVLKEGFLEIKGRKYSMRELVPDGLHLSQPTTEYLADIMFAILNNKNIWNSGRIQLL
ncbi:hypothetical protein [Nitrosomonas communis]|uniref:Lysophospholipase L1 n=1 Tax=Nitrosomonas communis TaxID=44574 RepID=A0A1I4U1R1_9PROT|nr:hypothetical protein [Nitrosomonas communis]SFM82829.1 hypothetical protein SAMN05421863_10583 [Nitrosomonas communis]